MAQFELPTYFQPHTTSNLMAKIQQHKPESMINRGPGKVREAASLPRPETVNDSSVFPYAICSPACGPAADEYTASTFTMQPPFALMGMPIFSNAAFTQAD